MEVREKLTRDSGEWHDTFNAAVTGLCSGIPLAALRGNTNALLQVALVAAGVADAMLATVDRCVPDPELSVFKQEIQRAIGSMKIN